MIKLIPAKTESGKLRIKELFSRYMSSISRYGDVDDYEQWLFEGEKYFNKYWNIKSRFPYMITSDDTLSALH